MRIGFRVDANEMVATGHLMRCISIAEQVRKQGVSCLFFLAENKCTDILRNRNFEYIVLDSQWDNLEYEIDKLASALELNEIEWLVIDSYQITKYYCEALSLYVKTMVIDAPEDEAMNVSAILNYSHLDDDNKIKELYRGKDTLLLLGLNYAPLREEYFPENQIYNKENQILITTGGTDPFRVAYYMTQSILFDERLNEYEILVVLGRLCTDKEVISCLNENRVTVLQGVGNMSELMQRSKVAFTAGGSTSIELCACNTPTVCFSFADNQIPFSKVLDSNGIIKYVGDARDGIEKLINDSREAIFNYINDADYRDETLRKMNDVCDGRGAIRIAKAIVNNE